MIHLISEKSQKIDKDLDSFNFSKNSKKTEKK